MPGVQIRDATPDDAADIMRLKLMLVESWEIEPPPGEGSGDDAYRGELRARIEELLAHPWYRYIVAVEGGRVVASASASITKHLPGPGWSGIAAHVADLVVEPGYRGQGIATALMDRCLAWCRAQSAYEVSMHATRAAVPMYRAMGWTPPAVEDPDGPFLTLVLGLTENAD